MPEQVAAERIAELERQLAEQHVCVFSETRYGYSGTELPPPVESEVRYAVLSLPGESLEQFTEKMNAIGIEKREQLQKVTVSQYSQTPGIRWQISQIQSREVIASKEGK